MSVVTQRHGSLEGPHTSHAPRSMRTHHPRLVYATTVLITPVLDQKRFKGEVDSGNYDNFERFRRLIDMTLFTQSFPEITNLPEVRGLI